MKEMKEEKKDLSKEAQQTKRLYEVFTKEYAIYSPEFFADKRPDSEVASLLFAIFCELRKQNEGKSE